MDIYDAITICLAEKFYPHLMPPAVLSQIKNRLKDAKDVLSKDENFSQWIQKIAVVQWGESLSPPVIDPKILTLVTDSLFKEQKFYVSYQSKTSAGEKKFLINPLGLVYRGSIPYIVGTIWDSKKPMQLAIHRIKSVDPTDQKANSLNNFILDDYIKKGAFQYHQDDGQQIVLQAIVNNDAVSYFLERPENVLICQKKDDESFFVEVSIIDSLDMRHTLRGFGNKLEITEPLYLREEIHQNQLYDELTGLHNRREFDIRLPYEIRRHKRNTKSLSLLVLDLDKFKNINDTYGHPEGDNVLQESATRIQQTIRDSDSVFRYGGEEFAVILPETDKIKAIDIAERIRKNLCSEPIKIPSAQTTEVITASIGISTYSKDSDTKEGLIQCADANCYLAKDAGRNCVR